MSMKHWLSFVTLVILMSRGSVTLAQNAPEAGGVAGGPVIATTVTKAPSYSGPADVNVFLVKGTAGQSLQVKAADQCIAGDQWLTLALGLPLELKVGTTSGAVSGECTCTPTFFEITLTLNRPFIALVAQKYKSGTDIFTASSSLQFDSPAAITVQQLKGSSC